MPTPSDRAADAVDRDEVLAFARALIAAPSENPGGTEDEAATVAADILSQLGTQPTVVRGGEGRPSVVAAIGAGEGPSLAWNGHLDTVPVGTRDGWVVDPFAGEIVDGRLVGRGACDMKGPIAAALAAAAALRRADVTLAGTLVFHLAADEEHAGIHGTKVLWERGLLTQDMAVVGEPSELTLGLAERGGAWITATAYGRGAHGSQPHRGVNAITSMARFLLRLPEALPVVEHPLCGRPTVNAAMIEGGTAPNVVPDRCAIEIDRRTVPGENDPDAVLAPFAAIAAGLRADDPSIDVRAELHDWTPAAETAAAAPVAVAVRRAAAAELGREPADAGFTGITDARFYIHEAAIPAVIFGPGSLSVAHTPNEWIDVDELVTGARIYARLFADALGA
jgi:acetylornithine deacetylase/succinyl-diaminopimelate desuccinylase family protein